MIGAPSTRSQKYFVGVIQATPGTPVSKEIADNFRNYYIDIYISLWCPSGWINVIICPCISRLPL